MKKSIFSIICLVTVLLLISVVSAQVSVGVKKGDWVEYQSTYTGTPPELSSDFFRFEILKVNGTIITYEGITDFLNGTRKDSVYTADISVSDAIDFGFFVIPSNLPDSGTFYSGDKAIGNLTVNGVEERTYAGVKRVTVSAKLGNSSTWYWDKDTGVLLELNDFRTDYSLVVKAERTNIWQTQLFGINQTAFYAIVISVVAVVVLMSILVLQRKKHADYLAKTKF